MPFTANFCRNFVIYNQIAQKGVPLFCQDARILTMFLFVSLFGKFIL